MARTSDGPRKNEFIGIPVDLKTKQRIRGAAKNVGMSLTEFARVSVVAAAERIERRQPVGVR